jgi:FkbM family methyltransferase
MEVLIVDAYGLKYFVDKNDKFIVEEKYEPYMKDVLKLGRRDVFVDVGAHVGKYAFYASKLVGDSGCIVAIEPHPANFENLKRGIEANELHNITAIRKACSNYKGKGFLREYEFSAKTELIGEPTRIQVGVDTLDNILRGQGIKRTRMVKVDVNGCEYEVLLGAQRTLEMSRPGLIVEVSPESGTKVFEYLKKYGYRHSILSQTKRYWDVLFSSEQKPTKDVKKRSPMKK